MCSIMKYGTVVGRNFDYEQTYDEELRVIDSMEHGNEYKIIGMCTGFSKYPLMYDGMNDCGLVCGALAFTGNAKYFSEMDDKINIPAFDFVFQILSSFRTVADVKEFLKDVNITDKQFSEKFPNSDLHWFIADLSDCIIVESVEDGLKVYDNPTEVMTNNPPFYSQTNVCRVELMDIREYPFKFETRGHETYGLVGDYTSTSRFARLFWLKKQLEDHWECFGDVAQGFHLLGSVEQIYGATHVGDKFEYTIYSVVYDMANGDVYLKFYDDIKPKYYVF